MDLDAIRSLMATPIARKFGRYFVVGGVSAITDLVLFAGLFYVAAIHYVITGTISFIAATVLNYELSIRFVFNSGRRSRHTEIVLVFLVSGVGILVNLAVLSAMIEFLALHPILAKASGTAAAFAWNFLARYFWIFDH